jgi:hypothetical protein
MTLYPFLVTSAVSPLKCDYASATLYDDPSRSCYDEQWFRYFPIMCASITLYGFALPIAILFIMIKSKRFGNSAIKSRIFSSLTSIYREEYFWWEFISIFKKMLLLVGNGFLRSLHWQDFSFFGTTCLLSIYQVLHAAFLPFKEHSSFQLNFTYATCQSIL